MKKPLTVILLFLFLLPILPATRDSGIIKIADKMVSTALQGKRAYQWLKELTSIGGRPAGSPNCSRAVKWAEEKMKALGFDRVYLQPVMVPRWERGKIEMAKIIAPGEIKGKKLSIAALGGSVGTPPEGIIAEVMEVKNFKELREKSTLIKGKIVFFNVPMDQGIVDTFRAYGSVVKYRWAAASMAAKYGAEAVIIRSITTRYDNAPHVGMMGYVEGVRKIPAVAIGLKDADFLSNALLKFPHLKLKLILDCQRLPETISYNVIGELKGSEFPEEVIVAGAHLDSWDKGQGAHDDGAGVVQVMEAVELFKRLRLKPKRTLRVVLFMNEEYGLSGARVYGEYAKKSAEIYIAAIESDRGGFTPRGFSVSAPEEVLEKIKKWLPYLKRARIEWIRKGGGGADISRIKNSKALIGYVPDDQRYFDFHHSDNDVFEAIHPRELELGSAAIAVLLYLISEQGL